MANETTTQGKNLPNVKPHSNEAEMALLGCMLIDRDIVTTVEMQLKSGAAFYNSINGFIFDMIVEVNEKEGSEDLITVNDYYERKKSKEVSADRKKNFGEIYREVNLLEYLTTLATGVVSSANYESYLEIVKRDFVLRRLIDVCNTTISKAYSTTEVEDLIGEAERDIFEISQEDRRGDLMHISSATAAVMNQISLLAKGEGDQGIKTGYKIFDAKTRGLHRTDLLILAARPAVGKTTFALNLLLNIAMSDPDKTVVMFSIEMSKMQLAQRLMANDSQIPMNMIQAGASKTELLSRLWQSSQRLDGTNVYVDDVGELTPESLIAKCRRLVAERKKPIDLILIDYLQLMNGGREFIGKDNRTSEIGKISRKLKVFAKELNCPIVALSQMSRSIEKRDSKIPLLSDLRESGTIEQDADIVMFLYADEDPNHQNSIILDMAKHRSGETFKERLDFKKEINKFVECDDQKINEALFKVNATPSRKRNNDTPPPGFTTPTGN